MSAEEKKGLINNETGEMDDSLLDEVSGGKVL